MSFGVLRHLRKITAAFLYRFKHDRDGAHWVEPKGLLMAISKIYLLKNAMAASRRKYIEHMYTLGQISDERGTILIIAPFILLVTLTLASIMIDLNAIYSAKTVLQDRIQAVASAAANQVSPENLYRRAEVTIDQSRAETLVSQQLQSRIGDLAISSYQVHTSINSVCIRASATFVLPALAPIIDSIVSPTVQANAVAVLPSPISQSATTTICTP